MQPSLNRWLHFGRWPGCDIELFKSSQWILIVDRLLVAVYLQDHLSLWNAKWLPSPIKLDRQIFNFLHVDLILVRIGFITVKIVFFYTKLFRSIPRIIFLKIIWDKLKKFLKFKIPFMYSSSSLKLLVLRSKFSCVTLVRCCKNNKKQIIKTFLQIVTILNYLFQIVIALLAALTVAGCFAFRGIQLN